MKRRGLSIIFGLVLATTMVATTPLSFVLDRAGLREAGFNWQQAEGTVFKGKLTGFSYGFQPFGTVELDFRWRDVLTGRIGYAVDIDGSAIDGSAIVALGRTSAALSDMRGAARIDQLRYFVGDVRNAGGRIEIADANIEFDTSQLECTSASGMVSSDTLSRFASRLANQSASELSGNIACESGALAISLEGLINQNDPVMLDGVLSAKDRSRLEVKIRTLDAALAAGLGLYGFEQNGDDYIIRQEVVTIGGLING